MWQCNGNPQESTPPPRHQNPAMHYIGDESQRGMYGPTSHKLHNMRPMGGDDLDPVGIIPMEEEEALGNGINAPISRFYVPQTMNNGGAYPNQQGVQMGPDGGCSYGGWGPQGYICRPHEPRGAVPVCGFPFCRPEVPPLQLEAAHRVQEERLKLQTLALAKQNMQRWSAARPGTAANRPSSVGQRAPGSTKAVRQAKPSDARDRNCERQCDSWMDNIFGGPAKNTDKLSAGQQLDAWDSERSGYGYRHEI
eukprot:TRINITY_DN24778_c0_g1_i1.p1 TRINITY_DN24778_c0_g1~~TRINITY_DN24778_c0_g1_i1.p1  ORF type:complete len:251 (+),score=34.54 TRINITY_DN24778_c0_g1_i1:142-894(+)